MTPTKEHAQKINELLSHGLTSGLGVQAPGGMCVEAAVCFALGLPHGDNPPCVGSAVRAFKISLNDSQWSSNHARAEGLRRLAISQLGSDEVNQVAFVSGLALGIIRKTLTPILLKIGLIKEAKACEACEDSIDLNAASDAASDAARAANYAARAANYAASYAASAASDAASAANYAARAANYAARDAASAASDAASAANYAASYAASDAARAANYAASDAASDAASAASYAASYAASDKALSDVAEIAVQVLIGLKCKGCEWLDLSKEVA